MNEHEIADARVRFDPEGTPNLAAAAATLHALMTWANRTSDGWAYWPKPSRAARRLMGVLHAAVAASRCHHAVEDVSAADLDRLYGPVRRFLNAQQVPSWEVIAFPRTVTDAPTLF